jgi:hypothetical protein
VGDFNGDNRPDLVMADSGQDSITTDTLAVLLNTTPGHAAPLTVDTVPSGLAVSVYYGFANGNATFMTCGAAPCLYTANWGSFFQIYATPTIAGSAGTQYRLDSFSDGGSSFNDCCGDVIHNVIFPGVAYREVVKYRQQFQVTVAVSPPAGGAATPVSGTYVDGGSTVLLNATPNPGFTFTQWTSSPGALFCNSPACSPVISQPVTWTANYTFAAHRCDLTGDNQLDVRDVQAILNQALGLSAATADLNGDSAVTVADIQTVVNAVIGTSTCPM